MAELEATSELIAKASVQGYADRLSVAPGEQIEFKVSCELPGDYRADVVRLIHGDTKPGGPDFKEEFVETAVSGKYPGRRQEIDPGSCVVIGGDALALDGSFTLHAFVYPTTPGNADQGILGRFATGAGDGYALVLHDGAPELRIGSGDGVATVRGEALFERCWYSLAATYDQSTATGRIYCEPVVNSTNSRLSPAVPISGAVRAAGPVPAPPAKTNAPFTIAGLARDRTGGRIDSHFNGKVDRPKVFTRALDEGELDALTSGGPEPGDGLLASWDFAAGIGAHGIPTDHVVDAGPNGLHGTCVNFPARGMTGYNWRGVEERFTVAPEQYGAIHFHDDDLEDAGWDTDIAWTVPDDLPSGVYGLRVRLGEIEEHFPFFVLPPRGRATAKALLLIPTMSYLAYANERLAQRERPVQPTFGHPSVIGERDLYLHAHPELGLSTYDQHSDGSGVHYSSGLRPIVGLRPRHRISIGGPWQFSADLHLVDWLEAMGFDYDVATDRELHDEGAALLDRYRVVLTGSHPEYYSGEMLDAWEGYLGNGGRGMYLGGNGFYWVTNWHPDKAHLIEVRKGELGTRAWQAAPGEHHLQTNGQRSGLWRGRARAPQKLFGVGFATQGMDRSSYFVQMPDSRDPALAFIMEGIARDELIGDFGLVGGGAAGYELDRYDLELGTPPHTRLLAYSEGLTDSYPRAIEDMLSTTPHVGATMDHYPRGDIVYFTTRKGGAVFSSSSITWCGSLSHDGYENNVSRMTANVLRRFLADEPL